MRAVSQLVSGALVKVDNQITGQIDEGLVVLLGVHRDDSVKDADYLVQKIINLRIFQDDKQLMNRSLIDVGGEILVVSQFTLFADCRKGRRPSYGNAAPPDKADNLYNYFIKKVQELGVNCQTGKFQAHMELSLTNDGPVTILVDSTKIF